MTSPPLRLLIAVVIGVVVGGGAFLLWQKYEATNIDGFYVVADSLVDRSERFTSSVYFLRVERYDSVKVDLAMHRVLDGALASMPTRARRDILLYAYTADDTASLGAMDVDDLAYKNPEVEDPGERLVAVRSGYVLRATAAAGSAVPDSLPTFRRAYFFRPRDGYRARDLR